MRLLMVAPPGAGKGTQARRLAERYGIEHIATGELLRHEVDAGTELGQSVSAYLERGDLVPDSVVLDMVADRVMRAGLGKGYVLDGYPRNRAQAEAARAAVSELGDVALQAVLHLDVSRDELRRRMVERARGEGRSDDTSATINHRLEVFDGQTEPLLGYYAERRILHTVDGEQTPDQVNTDIVALLEGLALT